MGLVKSAGGSSQAAHTSIFIQTGVFYRKLLALRKLAATELFPYPDMIPTNSSSDASCRPTPHADHLQPPTPVSPSPNPLSPQTSSLRPLRPFLPPRSCSSAHFSSCP